MEESEQESQHSMIGLFLKMCFPFYSGTEADNPIDRL